MKTIKRLFAAVTVIGLCAACGITFWAGHIYTYTIRLTESKAVIESVTVGGFTNEGDYNIDLNGKVTGSNPT